MRTDHALRPLRYVDGHVRELTELILSLEADVAVEAAAIVQFPRSKDEQLSARTVQPCCIGVGRQVLQNLGNQV